MATLLLVEDEPSLRLGLRLALEGAGHRVLEAATAQEAWPLLREAELVVLDWMLPSVSGIEVCRRLGCGTGWRGFPAGPTTTW